MTETKEQQAEETVRIRIIKRACELFMQNGIKDIKMDDIAKQLGISKRTIYEQFTDKKELLFECLRISHKYIKEKTTPYLKDPGRNSLEKLLFCYSIYFNLLKHVNKKFLTDLEKYPEIKKEREKKETHNDRIFTTWAEQCVKEGYFRNDIDANLVRYTIRHYAELITTNTEFAEYPVEDLGRNFILFYLRGIATEEGAKIIEKYIQNNNLLDL